MRYVNIDDFEVSSLAIGTSGIGWNLGEDPDTDTMRVYAIECAIDNGINFIDTAEMYGGGYAESIVGKAIKKSNVFVSTKVSPENLSYNSVISSVDNSLARLGLDCIDLYQIHFPNRNIRIQTTMEAMNKLLAVGKIKNVGVSNFTLNQLKEARCYCDIISIQNEYNFIDRQSDDIISFCQANDMIFMAYHPLDQGKLLRNLDEDIIAILTDRYGNSLNSLWLNFIASQKNVVAVFGSKSPSHIIDNIRSVDSLLPLKDIEFINSIIFQHKMIDPLLVDVSSRGRMVKNIYTNLEDAMKNIYDLCPSPKDVADEIISGDYLNPVKVAINKDTGRFDLIDGMIFFWGWVIAYGWNEEIEVSIRKF